MYTSRVYISSVALHVYERHVFDNATTKISVDVTSTKRTDCKGIYKEWVWLPETLVIGSLTERVETVV